MNEHLKKICLKNNISPECFERIVASIITYTPSLFPPETENKPILSCAALVEAGRIAERFGRDAIMETIQTMRFRGPHTHTS